MNIGKRYLLTLALLIFAIVAATCGGEATPTPAPTPGPAIPPEFPRLSPAARESLVQYTVRFQEISDSWEQLHLDFDRWREGLVACDASSLKVSLIGFASDFSQITDRARSLPRPSSVRDLVDNLVKAAEAEEMALRELNEKSTPDAPELFEAVDMQRAAGARVRNEVKDAILELKERASSPSRALVSSFSGDLGSINEAWDAFHQSYEDFRSRQPGFASVDVAAGLNDLVAQFSQIVAQVRDLPTTRITRPVAQIVIGASEEEELALRKQRDAVVKTGAAFEETEEGIPGSGFEELDSKIVKANAAMRQAAEALADIVETSSSEVEIGLQEFSDGYDALASAWDGFHQGYNAWRGSEGGCDRSAVVGALAQFSIRFSELAKEVRGLPRLDTLRPLGEVLVEAAEREEQALRALRTNWRPFDAQVYEPFDRERNKAGQLRRRVAIGINQLLTQHEISAAELVR